MCRRPHTGQQNQPDTTVSIPGSPQCRGARGLLAHSAEPIAKAFLHDVAYGLRVFRDHLYPGHRPHLREINPAETQARNENIYAVCQWLVAERTHRLRNRLRAVGLGPPGLDLGVSLLDAHFQWRMRHRKRYEFLPVFGPRQSPRRLQPRIERRGWQWG